MRFTGRPSPILGITTPAAPGDRHVALSSYDVGINRTPKVSIRRSASSPLRGGLTESIEAQSPYKSSMHVGINLDCPPFIKTTLEFPYVINRGEITDDIHEFYAYIPGVRTLAEFPMYVGINRITIDAGCTPTEFPYTWGLTVRSLQFFCESSSPYVGLTGVPSTTTPSMSSLYVGINRSPLESPPCA